MSGYSFLRIEKNKKKVYSVKWRWSEKNEQNSEEMNDLRKVFR